jgi:stearoyl-CoA desaturase (delta-9 desaturase)
MSSTTFASSVIAPVRRGSGEPVLAAPIPEVVTGVATRTHTALLWTVLIGPLAAIAAATALAVWAGIGPTWLDGALALVFYAVSGHGVTAGFHRYFTHGAFRANRAVRIALAVAGSLSVGGSVVDWVAAHRRHHAHADQADDPHSPWRFGTSRRALAKGLLWAHVGWLFSDEGTNPEKYAPDLLADRDIVRVNTLFPLWIVFSLLGPAVLGGLLTWSWTGALTAFLWAGLVRMFVLHHVTWSVNSVCHVAGSRPFRCRDKATNCWPLAVASMGESWHNLHHADPTSARHGVDRGQVDSTAVLIRAFERLGWATHVRWPDRARLVARRRACVTVKD